MDAIKEERFTKVQVRNALEQASGNVSLAAKNLDAPRSTLYNYLNRYPELKQILKDTRESMLDDAEDALRKAAKKGEGWAVCFMLKTIGRNRGYIEKLDIDVRAIDADIERELARLGLGEEAAVSGPAGSQANSKLIH